MMRQVFPRSPELDDLARAMAGLSSLLLSPELRGFCNQIPVHVWPPEIIALNQQITSATRGMADLRLAIPPGVAAVLQDARAALRAAGIEPARRTAPLAPPRRPPPIWAAPVAGSNPEGTKE